jgi:hypothetical protein
MSLAANRRKAVRNLVNATVLAGVIACAIPAASLAQPPDPCHSVPTANASAAAR